MDCVVFDPQGRLLLIRRKNPPFQGQYALPGGFVDYGETTERAAARELSEDTGLHSVKLSLIGVYSEPGRDPAQTYCQVAYLVRVSDFAPQAGDDAAHAAFTSRIASQTLAFDHNKIDSDARALK